MIVYADELVLLNGIVNYLLLLACGHLSGERIQRGRLLAAAGLGAIYALCAMLPAWSFLLLWGIKAAVCLSMVLVAYGRTRSLVRMTALLIGLSLLYAGLVLLTAALSGAQAYIRNGIVCYPVSYRAMVLTAALVYGAASLLMGNRLSSQTRSIVPIKLQCQGRQIEVQTLLDTGSELRDPITNDPVLILDQEMAAALLPKSASRLLPEKAMLDPVTLLQELSQTSPDLRPRLLPCQTVNGSGLLLAFRCQELGPNGGSFSRFVAISPTALSKDGRYQGLLGCGG